MSTAEGPAAGRPDGTQLGEHEGVRLTLRGDDVVDALEPLWLELFQHHLHVGGAAVATIQPELSWPRRRRLYQELFGHPGTFVVLAEREGVPVGYTLSHVRVGADDTWDTGDLIGEVETLVLTPSVRGRGLGSALLDATEAELARRGAHTVLIGVLAGNDQALAFYQRRGMRPTVTYLMRLGGDV